jgi:hypothetical protein
MNETEYDYPAGVEDLLVSLINCEACFYALNNSIKSGDDDDLFVSILAACVRSREGQESFEFVDASRMPARSSDLLNQQLINTTRRQLRDVLPFQIPILARTWKKTKAHCDRSSVIQRMRIEAEATSKRIADYETKSSELMEALRDTWGPVERMISSEIKDIGEQITPVVAVAKVVPGETSQYHDRLIELRTLKALHEAGNTDDKIEKKAKNWFRRDWQTQPKYGKPKWWRTFSDDEQVELRTLKTIFEQKWKSEDAQKPKTKRMERKSSVTQK